MDSRVALRAQNNQGESNDRKLRLNRIIARAISEAMVIFITMSDTTRTKSYDCQCTWRLVSFSDEQKPSAKTNHLDRGVVKRRLSVRRLKLSEVEKNTRRINVAELAEY